MVVARRLIQIQVKKLNSSWEEKSGAMARKVDTVESLVAWGQAGLARTCLFADRLPYYEVNPVAPTRLSLIHSANIPDVMCQNKPN